MATLSVWKFQDVSGAEKAEATLSALQTQGLITVHDAASVSWAPGAKKPKTTQMHNLAGAGALGGSMADVGIDDSFIKSVRDQVTPGTSALFLLSSDAVLDKVLEAFEGQHVELVQTNLDSAQEQKLRDAFAD